ncbi:MAG: MFS transporter, partial [Candidatus Heimdallarchaeota archaeon]|nr:MFS transporter [Candidatus Heimdallarchaeota archaeon]
MWKFRFYGFFKNLRFFEPYLLVMLLAYLGDIEFPLLTIGSLFLVQEVFTYAFEIPSGILADKFGKKNELLLCFLFYIASFVLYFVGFSLSLNFFFVLFIAAALYGLGESFRSGTHKAMILAWMDKNNYSQHKAFVYGRTRSWSLIGSTINGVTSIFLVLFLPSAQWVFIIAIIPYICDFILIATYPKYMNEHKPRETNFWKEMIKGFKDMVLAFKYRRLRKGVFSSATYDAIYKSLKDYIQPIIKIYILIIIVNFGLTTNSFNLSSDDIIIIILGVMYSLFYLLSSLSSRYAYLIKNWLKGAKRSMDILFYLFAGILLLNAVFISVQLPIVVIFLYLFIYIFENIRRPLCVDYLGGIMKKEQRATMLSAESQVKSMLVFIFAPLFGFIADFAGPLVGLDAYYSIPILFVLIAIIMVVVNFFVLSGDGTI